MNQLTSRNAPHEWPQARPEFIRLPKSGRLCPITGLSRSVMFGLCAEGKVRSRSLRKAGALRGTRLVLLSSLLEYLHNCPEA